jgi:hypothetical protein
VRRETGSVPELVHRLMLEPEPSVPSRRQPAGVWAKVGALALPA